MIATFIQLNLEIDRHEMCTFFATECVGLNAFKFFLSNLTSSVIFFSKSALYGRIAHCQQFFLQQFYLDQYNLIWYLKSVTKEICAWQLLIKFTPNMSTELFSLQDAAMYNYLLVISPTILIFYLVYLTWRWEEYFIHKFICWHATCFCCCSQLIKQY